MYVKSFVPFPIYQKIGEQIHLAYSCRMGIRAFILIKVGYKRKSVFSKIRLEMLKLFHLT